MTPTEVIHSIRDQMGSLISEVAPFPLLTPDPTLLFTNAGIAPWKEVMMSGRHLPPQFVIQPCFRSRFARESLLKFHMVTVMGSIDQFSPACALFISLLKNLYVGKPGKLHFILDFSQRELHDLIRDEGIPTHHLQENNDQYWVDWKFGLEDHLKGRGGTMVWSMEDRLGCSDGCTVHCRCGRHVPLGNILTLATLGGAHYFEMGFGIERLSSVFYAGRDLNTPPTCTLARQLQEEGYTQENAEEMAKMLAGIIALVAEGVRSAPKAHGYILRKLLRRTFEVGEFYAKDTGRERLNYLLDRSQLLMSPLPSDFQTVVQDEFDAYQTCIRDNMKKAMRFLARTSLPPRNASLNYTILLVFRLLCVNS